MPKNKLIAATAIAVMLLSCFVATGQRQEQQQQQDEKKKTVVDYEADVAKQVKDTIIRLIGSVVFHHNGAIIQCDSAYRYSDQRMDCFSNVIINQDSTYIYGDKVTYDGTINLATVYATLIKLTSGKSTVMYTYSLTFNTLDEVGEFSGGGIVMQNDNFMESDNGKFYAKTNDIKLENNVALRNVDYQIKTDSLKFNLDSEITTFLTRTYIWDKEADFLTSKSGTYERPTQTYTFNDKAYLMTKDQEVWADSIIYHSLTREALLRSNAQLLDSAQNTVAFGDWGYYNDSIKKAILTLNPSVRSWEKNDDVEKIDTAYMRGDSIFFETFPRGTTKPLLPDSTMMGDSLSVSSMDSLRMGDSLSVSSMDSLRMKDSLSVDKLHPTDSLSTTNTTDSLQVVDSLPSVNADSTLLVRDSIVLPVRDTSVNTTLKPIVVSDSIRLFMDSLSLDRDTLTITQRPTTIDSLPVIDSLRPIDSLRQPPKDQDTTERLIRALRDVRIFRKDFQGKCDSLVSYSVDSTMSMFGKPVLWNENNQITADQIDAYTINEKMDWADFIGNPFVTQQVDTSRYNQAKGRSMKAYFKDNEIDMTHLKGNVINYYYWEEDAEVVGFATMESAEMEMYFAGREPTKMKWIGQGDWAIYPIDQIPIDQPLRLEGFQWITQGRATEPSDICTRVERPSIRQLVGTYTKPTFSIEKRILEYRETLLKGDTWRDRTDIPIYTADHFQNPEGLLE